jgi:hypothetical protein
VNRQLGADEHARARIRAKFLLAWSEDGPLRAVIHQAWAVVGVGDARGRVQWVSPSVETGTPPAHSGPCGHSVHAAVAIGRGVSPLPSKPPPSSDDTSAG